MLRSPPPLPPPTSSPRSSFPILLLPRSFPLSQPSFLFFFLPLQSCVCRLYLTERTGAARFFLPLLLFFCSDCFNNNNCEYLVMLITFSSWLAFIPFQKMSAAFLLSPFFSLSFPRFHARKCLHSKARIGV